MPEVLWASVGLQGTAQFIVSAVLNTHLPVQLTLLVLLLAGASLLRDFVRLISHQTPQLA